jgi:hypothetical protein
MTGRAWFQDLLPRPSLFAMLTVFVGVIIAIAVWGMTALLAVCVVGAVVTAVSAVAFVIGDSRARH